MACVVCQHCQEQVYRNEVIAVRGGFSYHMECYKCYVCSETNLKNAETFKGVLFCTSCSQRIFQGCSTAKKTKDDSRSKSRRSKSKGKRREPDGDKKQHKRIKRVKSPITKGVLELAHLTASTDSDKSQRHQKPLSSNSSAITTQSAFKNQKNNKKTRTEIGMMTEVTVELLRQMKCPIVSEWKERKKTQAANKHHTKDKGDSQFNRNMICSDLTIAELGASTEIAHIALKNKSELPVFIKSRSCMKEMPSLGESRISPEESDVSGEDTEISQESSKISEQSDDSWSMAKEIGDILKTPYRFFKRNILDRSSLVSMMISNLSSNQCFLKRLKLLFHEEIVDHQHRGVKRLYSSINRRKIPYKLGWVSVTSTVPPVLKPKITLKKDVKEPVSCKHYKRSHSYRCMRANVMRSAGPTRSELACLRNKMKTLFTPKFMLNFIRFKKKYPAIMTSQACNCDVQKDILRKAKSN